MNKLLIANNDIMKIDINKYHDYINRLVKKIFDYPQVSAVYQLGGLTQPGISDIDLIVVTKNDTNKYKKIDLSRDSLCETEEEKYMLMHPPFVIPENSINNLESFFYCSDLRLKAGKNYIIESENKDLIMTSEIYKLVSFLAHTYPRFYHKRSLSIRSFLTFSYSLKHTYRILQHFSDDFSSKEIEKFIKNITSFRKNIIENHNPEKIDISDYREEGVNISKIMIVHVKTIIGKLYDIKVNSSNDIYYLKNYNDVFKFTTQKSKYKVINENNFNIVELPIEFAIFILFPLNDLSTLTEFQKKYIIGKFDFCIPNNLITQLGKIKSNHDMYHNGFMNSRVLNGMPFELNTTLFWQYNLIDNLSLSNLKYFIYVKYKMFKVRRSLKQTLLSTAL
jgi:hypothetical protein